MDAACVRGVPLAVTRPAYVQVLYFIPNGTALEQEVVVPTLATFFSISGSKSHPARNITIYGIEMTASRPTFMEPRTNPSGGDWALEREGAVRPSCNYDMRCSHASMY